MQWTGSKLAPLAVGLCLTVLLVVGLFAISRSQPAQPGANAATPAPDSALELRDVRINGEPKKGTQEIEYDVAWTTESFPGTHSCTWSAIDADGTVVGTYTTEVTSLRPLAADLSTSVDVSAVGVSAEGSCDPRRLDVGDPYAYEFRVQNVKMIEESLAAVTLSSSWLGSGWPGTVSCFVLLLDDQGGTLSSTPTSFSIASGDAVDELKYEVPKGQTAVGAEVADCRPFSGEVAA
jgi:hypothetical protein